MAKRAEIVFARGDSVELFVEEDKSFNGVFEVREGGYVLIPKIGRVMVAGLTRDGAEQRIRESLQRQQLKQATVFVEHVPDNDRLAAGGVGPASGQPRLTIYLTGAVARPGQHAVPLAFTGRAPGLFETLLITGGLAKFSDDTKVRIMRLNERGLRTPLIVDVSKIRDGLIPDVPIGDGDIIQVPEKIFGF
ncbi:polysaccharide biosynthesis/export family protein [Prosthecobacter sp.]